MSEKLDKAFTDVEKKIGKGKVQDIATSEDVPRLVSYSMGMNYVMGGGIPKGRIIELYGPESGGKSLLATMMGADYQREGHFIVYIDMEGTFVAQFAERLGLSVDKDKFRLLQPETGEEAFTALETLADSGEVGLVIVDSVAAMIPQSELEADYGEASMGSMARMMSQGLRKLNSTLRKTNTTVIFINQVREKIGVMYGNPETTGGGKALQFYASSRNRIGRRETIKNANETIGVQMSVTNKKSKVGPPMRDFVTNIFFDSGVDVDTELSDFAGKFEIIQKSGSWYDLPNGERVQGKANVAKYLGENPEVRKKIFEQVYERLFGRPPEITWSSIKAAPEAAPQTGEEELSQKTKERKSKKTKKSSSEDSADLGDVPVDTEER